MKRLTRRRPRRTVFRRESASPDLAVRHRHRSREPAMTISAIAEPPYPDTAGRASVPAGRADALGGAEDCAHRLMSRLHALGLSTSGPWGNGSSPMAVSAQCVQVEPYVGRTVWLLPPPGGPSGEPAAGDALYWHWQ